MPDLSSLTRLRRVVATVVALAVAVCLIVLWIPSKKLQDQSPVQTLLSPKNYTASEVIMGGPRWRRSFGCGMKLDIPNKKPLVPEIGDCYRESPVSWIYQYSTGFDVVNPERTDSRITALGVVGRAFIGTVLLQLIILLCITSSYGLYRLIAGDRISG